MASQYDLAGRRTRLTYPDGYYVTHEHLVTGEVSAIKESGATMLASFGYDDRGRRTLLTRGNGASTSYLYDPVSRLSQLSHDMIGTTGDVTYSYAYNPAGQIVTRDGSNDAYAWTAHGSGTTASSSNGLNQLATLGANTVTHDARGNLLADGQDRSFGYSSENLLTSFARPSTGQPANPFGYDPLTWFVTSGPSGGYQTSYLYDPVADVIVSQADPYDEISKFVHGPGQDEPLFALDYNGRRNWFHADERGSVIARSNADGTLRRIVTYDEYGKPGANLDNFMYTGAPFVLQGTYLMRKRFFGWDDGRFLQTDPIGYGDGSNLYVSFGGDSVNNLDPSGTHKSHWILRLMVPGQVAWDDAVTAAQGGDMTSAAIHAATMIAEQGIAVATLGQGTTAIQGSRITISASSRGAMASRLTQQARSAESGAASKLRNAADHERRAAAFERNPTVRPGMEGQPRSAIQRQQQERVAHLRSEAKEFRKQAAEDLARASKLWDEASKLK